MSWGYCSHNGPHKWEKFAEAAKGKRQSPINISAFGVEFDEKLSANPLKMTYSKAKAKELMNTGHSIQMTFATAEGHHSLSSGPLEGEYNVAQFHFHWGKTDDEGSEHTLYGKKYAAECHIVHYNKSKYATIGDAVDKSDGLCVLGMFIKVGKEHEGLKNMLNSLERIGNKNDTLTWKDNFDLSCLLPKNTSNYWTYLGSLTTPPCYESVTWVVFEEPIEFSEAQMMKLRALNSFSKGEEAPNDELAGHIVSNFRPPQPLYDRIVRSSFKN